MDEDDIRPRDLYDKLLELAKQDVDKYFESELRIPIPCPACESEGTHTFDKHGFSYAQCHRCETLYVTPRPEASAFQRYYSEAASVKYWANTFYSQTQAARRENIWKPRASKILHILNTVGATDYQIVDIGGGYGVFADEMSKLVKSTITIIEPSPDLAKISRGLGFSVVEKFLEEVQRADLPKGPAVFVSFELFEHLHSPQNFLNKLSTLMNPGDVFIFSTLSGHGLDIQVLWSQSQSICPPFHLNFLNPRSIEILLERIGFETIEVTTPGKLDIDILYNRRNLVQDKFWKTFLHSTNKTQRNLLQSTISRIGWSSHMMITSSKKQN